MPELRKDPITGRWVITSTERRKRPSDFRLESVHPQPDPSCPFCEGHEQMTPHELLAPPTMNLGTISGGFKTNVVPDRCVATVDLRTVPGQDHDAIVQEVRDMASELESTTPGLRLEIILLDTKNEPRRWVRRARTC